MNTLNIALVTAQAARSLDEDLPLLERALRQLGASPSIVDWDDKNIDWHQFDKVILRSTWDYTNRLTEFLAWATQVAHMSTLLNTLELIRWNTDKHYLLDLAKARIPIVPSCFVEPGEAVEMIKNYVEFVVKPAIGAGSRDAQRYLANEHTAAIAHAQRLLNDNRSVLVQPYLHSVDDHGETALIFFNGAFSHAIRKGPLLRRGEGPTSGLFATEHITSRIPSNDELAIAQATLAAIPFDKKPLYARVDLIHDANGLPCVLELELAEPSLFFEHNAQSALRFAKAILQSI